MTLNSSRRVIVLKGRDPALNNRVLSAKTTTLSVRGQESFSLTCVVDRAHAEVLNFKASKMRRTR